ncbi:unnamed protein product [marine sediment metagenome]|uniref:Uncharacterized protein n=1 Tax=marine sediment metagenome TaxID=412755 RepID=X1Q214_9ZZZZ
MVNMAINVICPIVKGITVMMAITAGGPTNIPITMGNAAAAGKLIRPIKGLNKKSS